MPVPIQKFREIVLQLLYSYDIAQSSEDALVPFLSKELSVSRGTMHSAWEKMQGVWENKSPIDEAISSISVGYALDRIQRIERNILRLGFYEMWFDEEIPPKVAISEAVRLARKFSTPEAASFVNALLDGLYKREVGQATDAQVLDRSKEELIQSERRSIEASESGEDRDREFPEK